MTGQRRSFLWLSLLVTFSAGTLTVAFQQSASPTKFEIPSSEQLLPQRLQDRNIQSKIAGFKRRDQSAMVLHGKGDVEEEDATLPDPLVAFGFLAQPVVWVSLYFVVTTGGGLPEGPFGLLGALEGVSYLAVVGIVGLSLFKKITTGSALPSGPNGLAGAVEGVSYLTILAGFAALGSLVVDQGCVPNAKPILDYSNYLPVCNPEETPGFFGGS